MKILYFDIDSLRADHLGCYGYHRDTSPRIDEIAAKGVRFDNVYASDAPCLPSRTAMFGGCFGIHNGVVNHGGAASEPFNEGPRRGFESILGKNNWLRCLRLAGLRTATISPFGERHSAWHWYAGFQEIYNTGKFGLERADEIGAIALDWLQRNAEQDNWFLHVNLWDPHTPYRTPESFGEPFADQPLPTWLTEEVRLAHWNGCGPHSARETTGYTHDEDVYGEHYPRQPYLIDSPEAVRKMFDGYDTGVRYADAHIGYILDSLAEKNMLDDTVVIITADHGENLGELNIYGDHQTADQCTTRVPLIVSWPGITGARAGRVDDALHYQFDFAATVLELLGEFVPKNWDAESFADSLRNNESAGRDHLVVSQGAWSCQRSVRFRSANGDYLAMRSYHDGHHCFPDWMLFDLAADPHQQFDLSGQRGDIVREASALLDHWWGQMMETATHPTDPFWTVMQEGGPYHTRGELRKYLKRLRATGRVGWADLLEARYAGEL